MIFAAIHCDCPATLIYHYSVRPATGPFLRTEYLNRASRFFHGGDSDSESSSSDEEQLYSDHGEDSQPETESEDEDQDEDDSDSSSDDEAKGTGASRFLRAGGSDSEESEDEDREKVVKSAKDKRLEEVEGTIKLIENAEKINDWVVISSGKYSNSTIDRVTDQDRIRQDEQTSGQDSPGWQRPQGLH